MTVSIFPDGFGVSLGLNLCLFFSQHDDGDLCSRVGAGYAIESMDSWAVNDKEKLFHSLHVQFTFNSHIKAAK